MVVHRTLSGVAPALLAAWALFPAQAHADPVPAGLLQRIGVYVTGFVAGFSNVVAQEDFALRRPKHQVRSDYLLVLFPGAKRDLLTFRDVIEVDGVTVPGRQGTLEELFLRKAENSLELRKQINLHSSEFVPAMLNPLFAISFLQPEYQPRFTMAVKKAGGDWPKTVMVLTFTETAKPTLLRTGIFGDQDVPTRGSAWVEETTGRILQTDLQVRLGKDVVKMRTVFEPNEELQIMVPAEMRTEKPDGVATYSNFRRFLVRTEESIDAPGNR